MTNCITLTPPQFHTLDWQYDNADCTWQQIEPAIMYSDPEIDDIEERPAISGAAGYVSYTATTPDGHRLTLDISWSAGGNTCGGFADLYDFDIDMDPNVGAEIREPVQILDDDGEPDAELLRDAIYDAAEALDWQTHARAELPTCPNAEDIDMTEDTDMDIITLERDNNRDVRFNGEKIATVSSREISGPGSNRWTELHLYRTAAGRLICHEVGRTQWQGEHDRHAVHIADDGDGLIETLGTGWLAKELYAEVGIECVAHID